MNVYGIELSNGNTITVLSNIDSIGNMIDYLCKNQFVTFQVHSNWQDKEDNYDMNNIIIKSSEIIAVWL